MDPTLIDDKQVTARTIGFYNQNAEWYWSGTRDHDVRQNIAALLDAVQGEPPCTILDLGCGPGRDLPTFTGLGHTAIGLDGAARLVEMAREYSGCEVWEQDFLDLDLADQYFDGIFANAALFHVPSRALPRVLGELWLSLKPAGVLFSSNPRGANTEDWEGERFGAFHDLEQWRIFVTAAGFTELHHYYRPEGRPRAQQPWLATVWQKN